MNAFAQWNISAGPVLYYSPFLYWESSPLGDYSLTAHMIEVGAVLDATYLQVGASYAFFLGGTVSPGDVDLENTKIELLNITLLGKYPIDTGRSVFWPAIGLEYSVKTAFKILNADFSDADELNDLYLLGGIGVDCRVAEGLILCPTAMIAYNLTPRWDSGNPDSVKQSDIRIKIGFQLRFDL